MLYSTHGVSHPVPNLPFIEFLHFALVHSDIVIDYSACKCKNPATKRNGIRESDDNCSRVVLKNKSGTFDVRLLSVGRNQLDQCNLAVFGTPEHPYFNDPDKVKQIKANYLALDFSSSAERQKFNRQLGEVFRLHDAIQRTRRHKIQESVYRSERPEKASRKNTESHGSTSRSHWNASQCSSPTSVDSMPAAATVARPVLTQLPALNMSLAALSDSVRRENPWLLYDETSPRQRDGSG